MPQQSDAAQIDGSVKQRARASVLIARDTRLLVAIFDTLSSKDPSRLASGVRARHVTWNKTLFAMALAAAGDTTHLRALVDTIETWGQKSLYGRDRRALRRRQLRSAARPRTSD